jgi:hypothetical protein
LTGCTSASLSPATPNQPAGSSVAFTATSGGCLNQQYEYWVQLQNGSWVKARGFSADPTFTWNTTGLPPGTYTVHVWANHGADSTASWEAYASSTVTLTGCTSATIAPTTGTLPVGTPVAFTATAAGCSPVDFEFWIQTTGGKWYLMQTFSPSTTWNWTNAGYPKGAFHIHVWANQHGAYQGSYEVFAEAVITLN